MGLALDEPKEGDEIIYNVDGLSVIVDPYVKKLISDAGGLSITSGLFGPSSELNSAGKAACNKCG